MNNHNAFTLGIANGLRLNVVAREVNLPFKIAVRIESAQDFHQRRFARAILTTW